MAITKIDNQAVALVLPGDSFQDLNRDCNCVGQDFCQLTKIGDALQFQVDVTARPLGELVTAGDFSTACGVDWTCGAGWSIAAGLATFAAGSTGSITQSIDIFDQLYYQIVFTVTNYAGGGSGTVKLGGKTVTTFTANSATNATFFIFLSGAPITNTDIEFTGENATSYDLDNVSVRLASTIGMRFIDIATGLQVFTSTTGTSITYGTTVGKAQISLSRFDFLTADQCYRVELMDIAIDTADLIVNGTFTGGAGWVVVGDWTFPGTVARHTPGVGSFSSTLQQDLDLAIDGAKCYTLTFDITSYTAGVLTAGVITTPGGDTITLGTAAAAGSFSFNIEFIAGDDIIFSTPNDVGDFDLDNVVLKVQDKCKPTVLEAECFKLLQDEDIRSECNTLLMTWTNDENAFGLDYENFTFVQKMRHCAKLYHPRYTKDDKDTYRDSAGNRQMLYSSTTKIERLTLREMPEYMHDALSIGVEHDTFKIGARLTPASQDDTVEYVNDEDDYDPEWRNSNLLAPITLEMIKDNQNLVNANC